MILLDICSWPKSFCHKTLISWESEYRIKAIYTYLHLTTPRQIHHIPLSLESSYRPTQKGSSSQQLEQAPWRQAGHRIFPPLTRLDHQQTSFLTLFTDISNSKKTHDKLWLLFLFFHGNIQTEGGYLT